MQPPVTNATVKLIPMYAWHSKESGNVSSAIAGIGTNHSQMIREINNGNASLSTLSHQLTHEKNCFGYILSSPDFIFASVDRIKSYPVYYGFDQHGQLFVSNCPYYIQSAAHLMEVNPDALCEFSMTSYVLGRNTLYQSLYQLQAGEFLLWNKNQKQLVVHRYYRYVPNPAPGADIQALKQEHTELMDRIIQKSINRANGRPIYLPLSGGLDSRFILAKLVEHQYDHIQTFSYGVRGNFEAKKARQIAKQLNVPWIFIPAKPKQAQQLFNHQHRRDYTRFAMGLEAVPSYLEYEALHTLIKDKRIPKNAFIINGQSGDYITGGHLPQPVVHKANPTFEDVFSAMVKKHCSLFSQLLTDDNLNHLKQKIMVSLPTTDPRLSPRDCLLAQYESWEWEARQSKVVVKGQRLYDFLGFSWDLPLWDPELMDFWQRVPFEWKLNQKLFIEYLQAYNYRGVFSHLRPVAKPWVMPFKWIPLVANAAGLLLGKSAKQAYYKRMYYYGTDLNQYAFLGRPYFLAHYKNARNAASLLVSHCLEEVGLTDAFI